MKTLRLIGMAIMAVIMSVNFTACSDDDEDNTPTSEKLIGQWTLTYEEGYEKEPSEPEYDRDWSHAPKGDECEYFGNFTFRADGTYTQYELDNSEIDKGKWVLGNNLLTITSIDKWGEDTADLKILELSSNKLVLEYYQKEDDGGEEYAKMTYQKK